MRGKSEERKKEKRKVILGHYSLDDSNSLAYYYLQRNEVSALTFSLKTHFRSEQANIWQQKDYWLSSADKCGEMGSDCLWTGFLWEDENVSKL